MACGLFTQTDVCFQKFLHALITMCEAMHKNFILLYKYTDVGLPFKLYSHIPRKKVPSSSSKVEKMFG